MKSKFSLSFLTLTSLVVSTQTAIAQQTPTAPPYTPSNRTPVADSTLGTQVSGAGGNFGITGGVNKGQTLFHSFTDFSVPTNGQANFLNPVGNRDIITRVTGNLFSDINGLVNTNGANFFLINPNGVVFGTNAQLNVGRAFVASTANGIDLVGGGGAITFGTNPNGDAPLLSVAPNVLFDVSRLNLGGGSGAISNFGTLQTTNPNQYIGLIGGNVSLNGGQIIASSGRVELGGLSVAGGVTFGTQGQAQLPTNISRGDVSLTNGARVDVGGGGSGDVAINARNVNILGGSVVASGIGTGFGTPATVAGDVKVNATGDVTVADGGGIGTNVSQGAEGKGGGVEITAANLAVTNGAQLTASTSGKGDAGNVKITASGNILFDNGDALSTVEKDAEGKGGGVEITAANLAVTNGAQLTASTSGKGDAGSVIVAAKDAVFLTGGQTAIFSSVESGGVGNGGNIVIDAGSLSLKDGAQLLTITRAASTTQPAGRGNAGNVTVKASGAVDIAGISGTLSSGIRSEVETGTVGNGGNITVDAGSLSLRDGARFSASTFGQGNAGNVLVTTKDAVSLAGGQTAMFSSVEAGGVGTVGLITINAGSLSLKDGAQLLTTINEASSTQPAGKGAGGTGVIGGIVLIKVSGAVDISGTNGTLPSGIISQTGTGTVGNGGSIIIDANSFSLRDGAQIIVSTAGTGDAGNVLVTAKDAVSLVKGDILSTVKSGGVGNGGIIFIDASSLSLKDSAQLAASTFGQGNAGNVLVTAKDVVSLTGGKTAIRNNVETGGVGNGSLIGINTRSLSLQDGAQLQALTFGQGNAGNVLVTAKDAVSLTGGKTAMFSTVESGGVGKGGNIDVNAGSLSLKDGAQLLTITRAASTTQPAGRGNAGNVTVKASGAVDIAGISGTLSSGIRSNVETGTVGNGGNITVDAGSLSLRDSARFFASTFGQGNAGNVTVTAKDAVSLTGGQTAMFSSVESGGVGKGGNIDVNAGSLSLKDGAQLLTITRAASTTQPAGRGNAGNVTVKASGAVDIAGISGTSPSGIRSNVGTGTVGNGGNITVDAGSLSLRDGGQLSASTFNKGSAGNILLNGGKVLLNKGNIVSTSSSTTGGNITIKNTDYLILQNNSSVTTNSDSTAKEGNGGNISITSPAIVAVPGNNDITANANQGAGGQVKISSQGLFGIQSRPKGQESAFTNDITASSTFGQDGAVNISTPGTDPGKDSTKLPNVTTDASNQISQVCNTSNRQNKLTVTGRGGLPPNANDPLTSDVVWQDARANSPQPVASSATTNPAKLAAPAVGWVFDGKGKVTLVAARTQGQQQGTSAVCPNLTK